MESTLTPGQIWLTNRGKSTVMTAHEIRDYIANGGKVLSHNVTGYKTYGVNKPLYTTEEWDDGCSYDLNYNVIKRMIDTGKLWPETSIEEFVKTKIMAYGK